MQTVILRRGFPLYPHLLSHFNIHVYIGIIPLKYHFLVEMSFYA